MKHATLEKWKPEAYALEQYLDQLPTSLQCLVSEAVDVGWFCELFWDREVDEAGVEIHPGLCSVERPQLFDTRIGSQLLELQEALQVAEREFRLVAQGGDSSMMDRACFVLSELIEVLGYIAYEDPKSVDVERLEILKAVYQDAATPYDVASALQNFGTVAAMHYPAVQGLGGFDAMLIKEAFGLSRQLRRRAVELGELPQGERRAALQLRNRIATLLCQRLEHARVLVRFVFRRHPELIQRSAGPGGATFQRPVAESMVRELGGGESGDNYEDIAM